MLGDTLGFRRRGHIIRAEEGEKDFSLAAERAVSADPLDQRKALGEIRLWAVAGILPLYPTRASAALDPVRAIGP